MLKFSVLLSYPDGETRFDHIMAEGPAMAPQRARMNAARDPDYEWQDFTVLLVIAGHKKDLYRRETDSNLTLAS